MDKNSSLKRKTLKRKTLKRKTLKKMTGGMGDNTMRLPLESNVSANGNGVQLGNDIINLVFSMINTITDTITTVTDVMDLDQSMGSEFSSPFSPGA